MVAFSASRLVCSAIEVMTLTTSPISREDSPSRATVVVVRLGLRDRGRGHPRRLVRRCCAISRMRGAHLLGARGDRLHVAATPRSAAAGDDGRLRGGLRRAGAAICADEADSSSADAATASAAPATVVTTSRREASAASSAAAVRPTSSPAAAGGAGEVAVGQALRRPPQAGEVPADPVREDGHRPAGPADRRQPPRTRIDVRVRCSASAASAALGPGLLLHGGRQPVEGVEQSAAERTDLAISRSWLNSTMRPSAASCSSCAVSCDVGVTSSWACATAASTRAAVDGARPAQALERGQQRRLGRVALRLVLLGDVGRRRRGAVEARRTGTWSTGSAPQRELHADGVLLVHGPRCGPSRRTAPSRRARPAAHRHEHGRRRRRRRSATRTALADPR